MALGRKLDSLLKLEPDVAIVQECAAAVTVPHGYAYTWRGDNPHKGLGVITKGAGALLHPAGRDEWTYFLPITFGGLRLLATWAYYHRAKQFGPGRVGNPMAVLTHLSGWLSDAQSIVAGDFNNSTVWDRPGAFRRRPRSSQLRRRQR
jgi:hypothetical protein